MALIETNMKIFSIIVTYNGMQWYDRCFSSLQKSIIPVLMIVVDNASSDGTTAYIRQNYPEIILMESKENLGFAKANNLGLKYAMDNGADYVFLLNQDAWLNQPETISALVSLSVKNPEYAILSPLQLYGSGSKIENEVLMHFSRNAKTNDDFISDLYFDRLKDVYNVPYACAVCWLMPIETVKNIGGFDPIFYHYGEDDNYIQRIKYFGYQVGICPKVSVCHDIETRETAYRDDNLDWKKYLLINIGDINRNLDMNVLLKSKLKVLIVQCLRINKKLLKQSWPEYFYLKKMQKEIENSRTQNKIKQANWLI
jgi:GT2 family glycosyltransferase